MQSSIKKNFVYRSALTLSTYIMGLITFPYISRVLGVEKLGLVNFVDNTINYFLLFATMGIGLIGIREVASVKDDKEKCSKVFSNILGLNIIFTIATLIVYFLLILLIPKLNQYSELFYLGAAKILFTAFMIEWFYTGIEDFRYITIRSIIVKIIYVISVFLLVRQSEDYLLYFIFTVGVVVINAIINIIYVNKHVNIIWRECFNLRYIKQNITLGIYAIMSSMYLTFNVMYLGLATSNVQVGYYTTAFKLYSIILGIISSFTNVMMPRMSILLAHNNKEGFYALINKSLTIIITISIPLIVYSIIMAPHIVRIISGMGYEGAVIPMQVIMPSIILVGIAQVFTIQILIPMEADRILLLASIIGALVSLSLNVLIVPFWGSIGSALVLLFSEFVVTITYAIYCDRNYRVNIFNLIHARSTISSLLLYIAVCGISFVYIRNVYTMLVASLFLMIGIFILCNMKLIKSHLKYGK